MGTPGPPWGPFWVDRFAEVHKTILKSFKKELLNPLNKRRNSKIEIVVWVYSHFIISKKRFL